MTQCEQAEASRMPELLRHCASWLTVNGTDVVVMGGSWDVDKVDEVNLVSTAFSMVSTRRPFTDVPLLGPFFHPPSSLFLSLLPSSTKMGSVPTYESYLEMVKEKNL